MIPKWSEILNVPVAPLGETFSRSQDGFDLYLTKNEFSLRNTAEVPIGNHTVSIFYPISLAI